MYCPCSLRGELFLFASAHTGSAEGFFTRPQSVRNFVRISCRILYHAIEFAIDEDDEAVQARLKRNREYMRDYRANPRFKARLPRGKR